MRRRMPPLATLNAFEAAGRLLSFSRAAGELLITQSAVSHHIRKLETALETRLFIRRTRAIELTPAGAAYLAVLTDAFDRIAEGTQHLRRVPERAVLKLSLLSSFATHWLIPRLPRFATRHPEIDLQLETSIGLSDIAQGEAQMAIRYGRGDWPGIAAALLMPERLSPVCSPAFFSRYPLVRPGDLSGLPLLFSYSRNPFEWSAWAAANDFDLAAARSVMLHDYNIVLQAALDGQGVAIGRHRLIAEALRAGTLVQPFPDRVLAPPAVGYWLVTRSGAKDAAVAALVAWLREEVGPLPGDA
jgi:LysR family transcriptional regulator, glycine cleavage system transcriptional activator